MTTETLMRRTFLAGIAATSGSLLLPASVRAQSSSYPSKPVRFIVGLGPGSGADIGTRFVAERFGKLTGQPATVENRPGGDGVVAVQSLLSAPADGHTIMYITPSPMVITPLLRPEVSYDALRDIRPVAFISRSYGVFVTGANSRFKTLNDVISEARAKPGTVKMSNYGHHYRIGGLSLEKLTGAQFVHVAYKGAGQANNDVIAGDIDVAITDTGGALALIEAGKLRPLAVTSPGRHSLLPNVPGMKELGLDWELLVWVGFGVSAKTPEPVAKKIEEILVGILKSPEYADYNARQSGAEIVAGSGEQLRALIAGETARYRELSKTMSLIEK